MHPEAAVPQYSHYIHGAWVPLEARALFENRNPADTRQVLSRHAAGTLEDVDAAVEAAHRAFPAWRSLPAPARARLLGRAAELVRQRSALLARTMTLEEGKLLAESAGEVQKGLNLLEFYVGEGWRLGGETLPSEVARTFTYTVRQPLGVAALITPWNFPFAIPCWKMAPALVAGNTVVLKPASWSPLTAALLVDIFHEAGFPPGVVNFVTGSGGLLGERLVTHPLVKVISFTGSTEVGRRINSLAASQLKKVSCEMGGKNPVIVLEDADLELAAEGILQGAFGSTGQRCTATSRVVVTSPVREPLTRLLLARMPRYRPGPGLDPASGMGPAVSREQLEINLAAVQEGLDSGARLLWGGKPVESLELAHGHFMEPAIFDEVTPDMRLNTEEIFGPVLSILEARDLDHALELANGVRYGLSSSLYARSMDSIMRYIEESEVGMVHVNSPTVGGEAQLPFGGIKESGVGDREMGRWGLEFFTELKTVFLDHTGKRRQGSFY